MRAHTPQDTGDPPQRRSSITGHRTSMGSSLPRGQSRISIMRAANSQPSFDFLTGAESTTSRRRSRIASGETARERQPEPEIDYERRRKEIDELKTEVKSLKYALDSDKQEEELTKLRHDTELRETRRKAEDDFKKMQSAEGERLKAIRQYESLLKEMTEIRDAARNEKAALERRVRDVEESKRVLQEEVDDTRTEQEESVRNVERRAAELESRNQTLQQTVEELHQDSERREASLLETQQSLAEKETTVGSLEAEVLRLKAQTGDADTLGIIKRELSEQVAHIRTLEATNREQAAELKHFRRLHKSIEVVEEEKRSLQRQVDSIEGLQNELGEARIQRQRLEDERLAWTAYLQSQAGADGEPEFDSPEAIARALVEERLHTATLVERLGGVEAAISEKENAIQAYEAEKATLLAQIEQAKTTGGGGDSKSRLRMERQRSLAIKEVEYLRAQLKAFDSEETTFQSENTDAQKLQRIQELEDMVDKYRQEVQTLEGDLAKTESTPALDTVGNKRPRASSEDNEQLGQLTRKNRKLQEEISTLQTSIKVLKKELSVTKERLEVATTQSKTRILSLRSNPTSDAEAIKLSTLTALRKENADLMSQLQNGHPQSVPVSALQASQRDVQDAYQELSSEKKRNDRLKKVWASKTMEFREAVSSILGWDVMFLPNGKMKVTSFFYHSQDDAENSIEFDGERGTMKISGGPQSAFAKKIHDQVKFWVKERSSIPCLLAALTLEFFEESRIGEDGVTRRIEV
ncbi:spindle assembly checkpoint component mad1 [Phlyctema vagabunda]|uniref:Spindle assembly checkpoint component MAD1 n=1 Tax=Phlyctema vagabunda TaxID=108571 RepID=A0ABR4PW95_9HELO